MENKKLLSLRMIPLFSELQKDCLEKMESIFVLKKL